MASKPEDSAAAPAATAAPAAAAPAAAAAAPADKPQGGGKKKEPKEEKAVVVPTRQTVPVADHTKADFGDLELIQSAYKTDRVWAEIGKLDASCDGQKVSLRRQ